MWVGFIGPHRGRGSLSDQEIRSKGLPLYRKSVIGPNDTVRRRVENIFYIFCRVSAYNFFSKEMLIISYRGTVQEC